MLNVSSMEIKRWSTLIVDRIISDDVVVDIYTNKYKMDQPANTKMPSIRGGKLRSLILLHITTQHKHRQR